MSDNVFISSIQKQEMFDILDRYNQKHVLKFWNEISDSDKVKLIEQVNSIDFAQLNNLVQEHILNKDFVSEELNLEPCEYIDVPKTSEELELAKKAKSLGEQYLRDGKVGLFVVAGGQGSRLGYDGPKGCFEVSPIKKKSIFQLHAEKIVGLQRKYGVTLPLYVMTSEVNHEPTKKYFENHDYFGLTEIHFFKQGMMPAVDSQGKLILEEKGKLFMNPNGHGGSIKALYDSGALADMKEKGIDILFYFQVDNILIDIADPALIGYHILKGAQMSNKALPKTCPEEKVGVFGKIDGKMGIVEYSVLPSDLMNARDDFGKLKFIAGNIAVHVMDVDFLEQIARDPDMALPFFKAFKKISYIAESGELVKPEEPNAYKFEMFVFDALKKTTNSVVMMGEREKDFAPVKNATGVDSADSARKMISDLHKSWLREAGVNVSENAVVEISSLFAVDAQELKEKLRANPRYFENQSEIYLG